MLDKLLSEIKKNNYKSISKAISLVENNDFNLPSVSEPVPINIISNRIDANDDKTLDNNEIQSFIKQQIFNQ